MQRTNRSILKGMAWLSVGLTTAAVLLRGWLLPSLRDGETGLFASGGVAVMLLLLGLVALAVLAFLGKEPRVEITGKGGLWLAISLLIGGGLLLVSDLWECWVWLAMGELPPPQAADDTVLGIVALILQLLCGFLGSLALVRLGLVLLSEGATRRGMAAWSGLAPVLWMWFRLARYEMSYISAVRLSQSFFDVMMFVLELLFLFKLARYTAGAGKVNAGSLQFLACSTAVFSLSGPLVRLAMYFVGDAEAFLASRLAGLPDVAVGLVALAIAFALPVGESTVQSVSAPEEEESETEAFSLPETELVLPLEEASEE
ncbi:MAG: hypothetical protein IJO76_03250 [Clostridia bacterium]|nr:hypothetical protein [Clostridia bacterium]